MKYEAGSPKYILGLFRKGNSKKFPWKIASFFHKVKTGRKIQ